MMKYLLFLIGLLLGVEVVAQQKGAKITVQSDYLSEQDTLELYYWKDRLSHYPLYDPFAVQSIVCRNGRATFSLDSVSENAFVTLAFPYQKVDVFPVFSILTSTRITAGDDLLINIRPVKGRYRAFDGGYDSRLPIFKGNWHCDFSGKGAAKFQAYMLLDSLLDDTNPKDRFNLDRSNKVLSDQVTKYLVNQMEKFEKGVAILKQYSDQMTTEEYSHLSNDFLGVIYGRVMGFLFKYNADPVSEAEYVQVLQYLRKELYARMIYSDTFNMNSPELYHILTMMAYLEGRRIPGDEVYLKRVMGVIDKYGPNDFIQSRLKTFGLLSRFRDDPNGQVLEEVRATIKNSYELERLKELDLFVVGTEFIDFTLPDQNNVKHSLSEYKGKVVLLDFWYMGCIPCRRLIEHIITPLAKHYRDDSDVQVILVSLDDQEQLKRSIAQGVIPKEAIALYTENQKFQHPLIKKLKIPGYPYPMLLDKEGKRIDAAGKLHDLDKLIEVIEAYK
ncbi:TlpA family protein disulfide reductase [Sphingobacterium paucimobilis]|nr:TlpA disulfide reductase family protein [Sphingobacterium paucimobilis]